MMPGELINVQEPACEGRMSVRGCLSFGGRNQTFAVPAAPDKYGPTRSKMGSTGHYDSMRSSGDLILIRLNIQMLFGEQFSASMRREAGGQWCGWGGGGGQS